MIAVLCMRERWGWINPHLHMSILEASCDANAQGRPARVECCQGMQPVDKTRNHIAHLFLKTEFDWLIMADNDIVPPQHFLNVITAAEEEGKFVVALPYPIIKEEGVMMCIGNKTSDPNITAFYSRPPKGWQRVDYAGCGLMAIRRCVLEKVAAPWFAFQENLSEDYDFCCKAAAAGFQVWTHGDYVCDHLRTCSLLQVLVKQGNAPQNDMRSAVAKWEPYINAERHIYHGKDTEERT